MLKSIGKQNGPGSGASQEINAAALASINATKGLSTRGLKPVGELAANREHGDRLRYMAGCRCEDCRRANSSYEAARHKARKAGEWNGIVPAKKARQHLKTLSAQGVGRRSVSIASDIGETALQQISSGRKANIRANTERAILAVTNNAAADHALVPAEPTWKLINRLLNDGHTKSKLAKLLGGKTRALQLSKKFVTVRSAYAVERLFEKLRSVNAKKTESLLKALRDEGYLESQINQRFAALALNLGEETTLEIKNGRVSEKTEILVKRLYEEMTA